ncbi:MAG: hypothetical protein K2K09_07520, partial [Lachnospiraceae bacterium]|nr:hypothetical protein [Lachnospiraceae bacterium]
IRLLYDEAKRYNSDMVFCGYRMVDTEGGVLKSVKVTQSDDEATIYKMMTICMRIFKREFIEKHNITFPVGVRGEDIPFNMTVNALGSNIRCISYEGYNYVQHSSSAMKKMAGLGSYRLPVKEIAETMEYIRSYGCKNSWDYVELCALRSYAFFIFIFGRKSKKDKFRELYISIKEVLDKECPECYKNPYVKLTKPSEFPLVHRVALVVFTRLYRMGLLYQFAYLFTRI